MSRYHHKRPMTFKWPPNSPNIKRVAYHLWGAILEAYCKLKPKPKTSAKLKEALQVIWASCDRD